MKFRRRVPQVSLRPGTWRTFIRLADPAAAYSRRKPSCDRATRLTPAAAASDLKTAAARYDIHGYDDGIVLLFIRHTHRKNTSKILVRLNKNTMDFELPEFNIKCVVISGLAVGSHFLLPRNAKTAAVLAVAWYAGIAWYDALYDCDERLRANGGLFGLVSAPLKPAVRGGLYVG